MPSPTTSARAPGGGATLASPRYTTEAGSTSAPSSRLTPSASGCTSDSLTVAYPATAPSLVNPISS